MAERKKAEVFECPECGNKQPLNKGVKRTVSCINCETDFAIVATPEGEKALVKYFDQPNQQAADAE